MKRTLQFLLLLLTLLPLLGQSPATAVTRKKCCHGCEGTATGASRLLEELRQFTRGPNTRANSETWTARRARYTAWVG
jgi:hypothetical protein